MSSTIRTVARLCVFALALTACLRVAPVSAANVTFIANGGSDLNPCTFAQPCASFFGAIGKTTPGGQVTCMQGVAFGGGYSFSHSVIIDCPGVFMADSTGLAETSDKMLKVRNLVINGQFAAGVNTPGILIFAFGGGGTLVIENCVIENFSGPAIWIDTNGAFSIVIKDTRVVNNASGVLIHSQPGGNINATFDRVTISQNASFGLKADGTGGGPIMVAITDSTVSFNGSAGVNAVSGPSGDVLVNVNHTVIASNAISGVRANGSSGGSAAVMVGNSNLIDNGHAWDSVGGGLLGSFRNNQVIGPTGTPPSPAAFQ